MADWIEIDSEAFTGSTAKAYETHKAIAMKATEARQALEVHLRKGIAEHVPDGMEARFSYRFGKVAATFVEKGAKKAGGKGKLKL